MTRALLVMSLVLVGCRSGDGEVERRVVDFCSLQGAALHAAVDAVHRGSTDVIGLGDLAEHTTASAAFREFAFCVSVREADEAIRGAAMTDFQGAAQALSEHTAPAEETLARMAALYDRVNGWPLR